MDTHSHLRTWLCLCKCTCTLQGWFCSVSPQNYDAAGAPENTSWERANRTTRKQFNTTQSCVFELHVWLSPEKHERLDKNVFGGVRTIYIYIYNMHYMLLYNVHVKCQHIWSSYTSRASNIGDVASLAAEGTCFLFLWGPRLWRSCFQVAAVVIQPLPARRDQCLQACGLAQLWLRMLHNSRIFKHDMSTLRRLRVWDTHPHKA